MSILGTRVFQAAAINEMSVSEGIALNPHLNRLKPEQRVALMLARKRMTVEERSLLSRSWGG